MQAKITKHNGGIYTLYSTEKINTTIDLAWDFFSNPRNLNKLTPPDLNFKITSGDPNTFYQGKIITYSIRLLLFLQFNWTTEISNIKKGKYFIDKQLFGPYKLWHHEHHFTKNDDGTVTMVDKVKYKLYMYPISRVIHKLFVKKELLKIFNYRKKMIHDIFPKNDRKIYKNPQSLI